MRTLGAFALIRDAETKILLCHRTDLDIWNLPGGRVEPEEAPWEAVVREVHEETGLHVRVDELIGVYWVLRKQDLVFTFHCHIVGGKMRTTPEADDVCWFAVQDLPANTLARHVQRIHDSHPRSGTVHLSAQ